MAIPIVHCNPNRIKKLETLSTKKSIVDRRRGGRRTIYSITFVVEANRLNLASLSSTQEDCIEPRGRYSAREKLHIVMHSPGRTGHEKIKSNALWLEDQSIERIFTSRMRCATYFCRSALYEEVSSSNNLLFISINDFNTLYTRATIVLKRGWKQSIRSDKPRNNLTIKRLCFI